MTLAEEHAARSALQLDTAPRPLRPVRVAVFGMTRVGLMHTAVLAEMPDCQVVAVGDPGHAARRNARGMGIGARAYSSPDTLLRNANPEAVVVCAPVATRTDVAVQALEAGAAVLLDVRPSLTTAEITTLLQRGAERGRVIACAHTTAFHPVFHAAKRVLDAGIVGDPRRVRASVHVSRVFSPAQQHAVTGGVLAHTASDLLFLLHWYFGSPSAVTASANRIYGPSEDEVQGRLILPHGAEVGFEASWSAPGYPRTATVIEVEASAGRMLLSDDALEVELAEPRAGFAAGTTRIGLGALPLPARYDLDGDALYVQDGVFLAWATGAPGPPASFETDLGVARVRDALQRSLRDNGVPAEVAA